MHFWPIQNLEPQPAEHLADVLPATTSFVNASPAAALPAATIHDAVLLPVALPAAVSPAVTSALPGSILPVVFFPAATVASPSDNFPAAARFDADELPPATILYLLSTYYTNSNYTQ